MIWSLHTKIIEDELQIDFDSEFLYMALHKKRIVPCRKFCKFACRMTKHFKFFQLDFRAGGTLNFENQNWEALTIIYFAHTAKCKLPFSVHLHWGLLWNISTLDFAECKYSELSVLYMLNLMKNQKSWRFSYFLSLCIKPEPKTRIQIMQETTWQSANFFVAHLLVSAEIYVALLLFVFGFKRNYAAKYK